MVVLEPVASSLERPIKKMEWDASYIPRKTAATGKDCWQGTGSVLGLPHPAAMNDHRHLPRFACCGHAEPLTPSGDAPPRRSPSRRPPPRRLQPRNPALPRCAGVLGSRPGPAAEPRGNPRRRGRSVAGISRSRMAEDGRRSSLAASAGF
jgi:hypothetical protein